MNVQNLDILGGYGEMTSNRIPYVVSERLNGEWRHGKRPAE